MALANELAGCTTTPADSQVYLDGEVQRVLFGIDVDLGELELWLGAPTNPVGRWVVQMPAGTNGGAGIHRTYYEHGINTILAMHLEDRDLRELELLPLSGTNLIITGHMPSDSIGVNRVIDALEGQGLEVIAGSGVIRE